MKLRMILSVFFLCFIASSTQSQSLAEKIKRERVTPGAVIKKGKKTNGYLKISENVYEDGVTYAAPWNFQGVIKFIEKEKFETNEKIKNKDFDKFYPKDLDGYEYDGQIYVSGKYADLSGVGVNMLPKKVFLKLYKEGSIRLFHYFSPPPPVIIGEDKYAPYYEVSAMPTLAYQKGRDGKYKTLGTMSVKKQFAEWPNILEKYDGGAYNVYGNTTEDSSNVSKFVNQTVDREAVLLHIIEDYNQNCGLQAN